MKVTRETMRMEACSLCSPVAETGRMLSPLTPSHSLHERLARREPAFRLTYETRLGTVFS